MRKTIILTITLLLLTIPLASVGAQTGGTTPPDCRFIPGYVQAPSDPNTPNAPSGVCKLPNGTTTITQTTLLEYVLISAIITYGILRLGEALARILIRMGRDAILFIDPDSGGATLRILKRAGNTVSQKVNGEIRTYILDGRARLGMRLSRFQNYALWIVHARHGHNLRGLTDAENLDTDGTKQKVLDGELSKLLLPDNPASYHHATAINEAQDALRANEPKNDWHGAAIIAVLIISLVALGCMVYLIYNIGHAASTVAAAKSTPTH